MKRICFFAHYDRDDIIDDYVLYYLKYLKKFTDKIVLASDSNLPKQELKKLEGLAVVACDKHHGEYDFGSWKKCFEKVSLVDLEKFDELLLVNDSCFGPFSSFEPIFQKMAKAKVPVWGLNWAMGKNIRCLESYFLLVKKEVFNKRFFLDFFSSVKKEAEKGIICDKYEAGFSRMLKQNNVPFKSYRPIRKNKIRTVYLYTSDAFSDLKSDFPLIKTGIFKTNIYDVGMIYKKLEGLKGRYPAHLIKNYIKRFCGTETPAHYFLPYSRFRKSFIHYKVLQIFGKYTQSRKWFYIGVKVLGIPVFRFWLPVLKTKFNAN